MSREVVFDDQNTLRAICGANDANIPYMESLLGSMIYVRGNSLMFDGNDPGENEIFGLLMQRLEGLSSSGSVISESEIFMEYQSLVSGLHLPGGSGDGVRGSGNGVRGSGDGVQGPDAAAAGLDDPRNLIINLGNRSIYPKTNMQRKYLRSLAESQITFAVGPAGTGKTFLAVAYSLAQIISGKKQKLILSRPVVEAGESLGFLPGDLAQKLNPYLKPLYDSMEFMIPPQMIRRLEDSSVIETAPLAYMRGRSLHHACIILDEAQNTTVEQMKMFLTRLGEDSTAIITGDITQTDLPRGKVSGLVNAMSILQGIEGISFMSFHSRDVVRSRIVQRIVDAYEKNEQ